MTGLSAFDYTNSVGENLHVDQHIGEWQNYPYLESFLKAERIKFVRSSLTIYPGNGYSDFMNKLNADLGINAVEIVGPSITTPEQIDTLVKLRHGSVILEGPNEPDVCCGDMNWIAHTKATMTALAAYHAMHPEIPIVAPAISMADPAVAADLTAVPQFGNAHPYTGRRPPETTGWGGPVYGQIYGSLAYNIADAQRFVGQEPVIATEAGFSTANVTEATQSAYIQRQTLWDFMNGIVKTILYDLVDDSQGYGLARIDGSMKPAAYGLQGLRAALWDTKPFIGTCSLDVTIQTTVAYKSLLLCKSNGERDLVLWQPTQLQDPDTGAATPATPADLSISANGVGLKTIIYLQTPNSHWTWQNAPLRGKITGALTERPLIIAFNAAPTLAIDALPVIGTGLLNGIPIAPGTAKVSPN